MALYSETFKPYRQPTKEQNLLSNEVVDAPPLATSTVTAQDDTEQEVPPDKCAALLAMVCCSGVDLIGTEQYKQFMLLDFADTFTDSSDDFGSTTKLCHQIPTGDSAPIRQALKRIPPTIRA